ncbi:MAG: FAD-dependent thymidylate synthase [Rhodospirillaceae bacterium]|nr:FAD-dependent thymidylate synthase [Rhodospirillaceae bacterium]
MSVPEAPAPLDGSPATSDAEIAEARAATATTRRPTVAAMEDILFQRLPVLDHGFVRVVDYMGDDAAVVQAARVSYGRGTRQVSQDAGLIRYLMRHWHTTPFEMCELKLHVKLPIFVARQWIRHRTANVNEYSARYSILDREFYLPAPDQVAAQSSANRQGRGDGFGSEAAARVIDLLREDAERCYADYLWLLNEDGGGSEDGAGEDGAGEDGAAAPDADRPGLARELARMNLTLNTYTQWYWKTDLHNLMHFLRLRADPHAQYEIRVYAEVIADILTRWVPITAEAFRDYRLEAAQISRSGLGVIKRLLAGEAVDQKSSGLNPREWRELMAVLGRPA